MTTHFFCSAMLTALVVLSSCDNSLDETWIATKQDSLIVGIEITGSLKATDSASISPPGIPNLWEYKISSMVDEGTVVKPEEMVVAFDTSSLKERLRATENTRDATSVQLKKLRQEITLGQSDKDLQIAEAEAALRKATMTAEQSSEFTSTLVLKKAALDLEAAKENVTHLKAQQKRQMSNSRRSLASLQATLDDAQRDVEDIKSHIQQMTILAPREGTVIYGSGWGDEKYKVGDNVWRISSVMEIASLDSMMAEGVVDEADSAALKVGQLVSVRLEAHPDSDVRGTITEVGRTVQRKSREIPTKVVAVKLSIDPVEGLQLRPGMRFRGEIESEKIDSALLVPLSAVFSSRSGPIVFKQTEGGATRVSLTLGKSDKRQVQVLSGLSAGDKISSRDLRRSKP